MKAKQIEYITIDEAFDHFAKSIVIQAIDDYREVLRTQRIRYTSHKKYNQTELENFFRSDWCYLLSGYDGEELIELIRKQENYHDATN